MPKIGQRAVCLEHTSADIAAVLPIELCSHKNESAREPYHVYLLRRIFQSQLRKYYGFKLLIRQTPPLPFCRTRRHAHHSTSSTLDRYSACYCTLTFFIRHAMHPYFMNLADMELAKGIEPSTCGLQSRCSTIEPRQQKSPFP